MTIAGSDTTKRITAAVGLAGALVLACLLALGTAQSAADTRIGDAGQTDYVGINGAPCAYPDIPSALMDASDGDTIFVSRQPVQSGVIGRIEHELTFAAATNNCQDRTFQQAYVDAGGMSFAPNGGLAVISSGKTVTFASIRLQNARAEQGGIVYVEHDAGLVLEDSHVEDGVAGGHGGGIYVSSGGRLLMSNSAVDTSEVTKTTVFQGGGGGVYVYRGTMTMTNLSRVGRVGMNNGNVSAQDGGGIYLQDSSLYAEDSWVLNNAAGRGGGIFANGSSIRLFGDLLIGADTVRDPAYFNLARDGGGLYLERDSLLVMGEQAEILWNTAFEFGGGMYVADDSEVAIHNDSRVYSNTATFGGGVYLTGSGTILNMFGQNVRIESNRAREGGGAPGVANGGGIYVTGAAEVYANATRIISNQADLLGGGIYVAQDGASLSTIAVLEDGAELAGNVASYGGGAYLGHDGSQMTVDNVSIRANGAITKGGGIRTFGDNTLVVRNGSVISGNLTLDDDGGGLALDGGRVWIADSWMENNGAGVALGATGNGGAVHLNGGTLTMTNSFLVGNTAYTGGGLSTSSSAVLTNVRIIGNYGSHFGGGIVVSYGDLEMGASFGPECRPSALPDHTYCSEVRGNRSPGSGAGLHVGVGQNRVSIGDTAFLDNVGEGIGTSPGAALSVNEGVVSMTNGLVSGNGANANSAVDIGSNAGYFSENSTYAGNQDVPLFVDSQGSVTLTLNIIWDNGLSSDIQGSLSSRCNNTQVALGGSGDISQDPRFVNLRGPYRLGLGSPAIDTCIGFTDHDLDGKSRPFNIGGVPTLFVYDMGAFEARPPMFIPLVLRQF